MANKGAIQFNTDIQKWIKKANGNTERFLQEFCSDIGEAIVMQTPWITGFLRGSWTGMRNKIDLNYKGRPDKDGVFAITTISLAAAQMKSGDVFYITNNANYALHVEFGTYKMAPRAMVRGVFAQADNIAEQVIARLPK